MAASKLEKVEEFLSCIICTEPYNDPCTLRCDHTFCRKCITQYLKTKPEAIRSKTIPCPQCRQLTTVPDPSKPLEDWAKQFKPSIIIVGLLDTLEQDPCETDVKQLRACSLCEKIGETTPGISWCQHCEETLCDRCVKMHRVNTATRDHEVGNLTDEIKVRKQRKIMCKEHKDEIVRFHCKDCKKSACQTCCIIHHRACKTVVTIEAMKSTMKNVLSQKSRLMSKKLEIKTARLQRLKAKIREAEREEDKVKTQIRSARQRAIEHIKKKEYQLLMSLREITEKRNGQLQADVKREEIEMQACNQHYKFFNQASLSSSEMDMYNAYMACDSGAAEIVDTWIHELQDNRQTIKITFTQNREKFNHVLDDIELGRIDIGYQDEKDFMFSPMLYYKIDAKLESDDNDPFIVYGTVLDVDDIRTTVVSDHRNKCVKSFYIRNNKLCHSQLHLDKGPFGMTTLKENQVLVTVLHSQQIVKVHVTPDLVLLSVISTNKGYASLSVLDSSTLVAGCADPSSVDILSMDGQVLKSFTKYNNDEVFLKPMFLTVSKKRIMVSDNEKKSLTCLTLEGDMVWEFPTVIDASDSKYAGVCATKKGDILLTENMSKNIIQLSDSGQFVRDVLTSKDGLEDPTGIHLDDEGKLTVCECDQIKVFIFA